MIPASCDIYVIGQGFVNSLDLTCGDPVHTLDLHGVPGTDTIQSTHTEFLSGKINRIDSGMHNVDVTDDARLLYLSDRYGYEYINFQSITHKTPNKRYDDSKYLPVLSELEPSEPQFKINEIEGLARRIAVDFVDVESFLDFSNNCSGSDAAVFIDMLDFWAGTDPGKGWFGRAQVKSRCIFLRGRVVAHELCRVAVLAGYTSYCLNIEDDKYAVKVSFESTPIPGSRPKNEKYYKTYYVGNVININANNKPIMGRSRDRILYLPTGSTLN